MTVKGTLDRTIRGIRDAIPSGYVLGRQSSGVGAPELISLRELGAALKKSAVPGGLGGGGGGLTPISDKQIISNISGGSAVPIGHTLSDILDAVLTNTRGTIIYRGVSGWAALSPSAADKVLRDGGAGADPSWVALSAIFDTVFGNVRGDVLYRGATTWAALGAGTAGEILVTNGTGGDPAWTAPGSVISKPILPFSWPSDGGVGGDAFASLGEVMQITASVQLLYAGAVITTVTGRTYQFSVAPYDTTTHKMTSAPTVLGSFTETSGLAGKSVTVNFSSAPITLGPGIYIYYVTWTNAPTTTSAPQVWFTNNTSLASSINFVLKSGIQKLASLSPTTSDTWSTGGANLGFLGLYTF